MTIFTLVFWAKCPEFDDHFWEKGEVNGEVFLPKSTQKSPKKRNDLTHFKDIKHNKTTNNLN